MPSTTTTTFPILTLDLLLTTLTKSLLHPLTPPFLLLCLRAQATPYTSPSFLLTSIYALLLTAFHILHHLNAQFAHGPSRTVDLSDEVVVVTGGASGLGLLIARIYALRGVRVAVLDLIEVDLGDGSGIGMGEVGSYKCDVGDRGEVESVLGRVERELGPPTVLIHCAAARINGLPLRQLSSHAFQKTIQTNLLAAVNVYQLFLPRMLEAPNGGTIVTVSSVLGQLCAAGLADYSASKAGLSALHRSLEAELRVSGDDAKVKMILVESGQIATPLFESVKTPNRFFAPVLEPVQVAQAIVSAVDSGRGGVIRLPAFAMLVNWYAVLPASVQRLARYLSGIDSAVAQAADSSGRQLQSELDHVKED
ncbi:NAD(P)-binding protein [Aspergillus sclerotioniger CBS 115572]|uniref:NAD(P)-binding protein n=1 Tax=Aspergillus sclerotioniger CBS 115572 TaxID=1450535 RepID=A0A317VQ42_9EURO|nr:NAD(P)-binding protein [Aspergillus sclerotioniger CBS 115572]PWY76484.1 NAD(P)-binding protein [Aspergillus sclerotioniger CBS 115572]